MCTRKNMFVKLLKCEFSVLKRRRRRFFQYDNIVKPLDQDWKFACFIIKHERDSFQTQSSSDFKISKHVREFHCTFSQTSKTQPRPSFKNSKHVREFQCTFSQTSKTQPRPSFKNSKHDREFQCTFSQTSNSHSSVAIDLSRGLCETHSKILMKDS